MLTVTEATHAVLASVHAFGTEQINTEDAVGRVLREPVFADRDYPPIHRSTMDGIAINCSSWESGQRTWSIEATLAAGAVTTELQDLAGGCVRIMTGAEVPGNCDGIIPVEQVEIEGESASARADAEFAAGQFVHVRGSDRSKGDLLLSEDTLLTPPRIAVLASVGHAKVRVTIIPKIAVISTGDEIVAIDRKHANPNEVRASNLTGIKAGLNQLGFNNVTTEHIHDDFDKTAERISDIIDSHDILILSGGVSMGKFDYVPAALEKAGVRKIFHRVAQRPGKPLWFGQHATCTVFGLPGNPVSTLAVFRRYVVPFLQKSLGHEPSRPFSLKLNGAIKPHEMLTLLYPVRLNEDGASVSPVEYHGSGDFAALSGSDGFVEIPSGNEQTNVDYWPW